jgi:hypothetical protein
LREGRDLPFNLTREQWHSVIKGELSMNTIYRKPESMLWRNKNVRGAAILVLLLVAMMGPWTFDKSFVTPDYVCGGSFSYRLDDNFCGQPVSILSVFSLFAGFLQEMIVEQEMLGAEPLRISLMSLLLILLLLPFFSMLLLLLGSGRWRLYHAMAWGLAAVAGLIFLSLFGFSRSHWALWGAWLYIGLTSGMLLLEALAPLESSTMKEV